ncbi:PD-(D/E)XK nuclease domain-containing protein [Agathobacter sp.]|uniref:PD-(D/E)XK nuclease domain-containing protein n=1 Tax=Agathobacter sp. TaxID=2021311 RepID=UPI002A90CCB2|nr:PD-(D/E)XK nuclease domain-containing protein [Agathobacter sp.]MDY5862442.1 PD-(D/E)XK nuclease domain-containing protein [Agathobacter sp.]
MLEFKAHDPDEEKSLKETAASALAQIEEKNYDAELIAKGITKDRIKHYGFAFEDKKVLIM